MREYFGSFFIEVAFVIKIFLVVVDRIFLVVFANGNISACKFFHAFFEKGIASAEIRRGDKNEFDVIGFAHRDDFFESADFSWNLLFYIISIV